MALSAGARLGPYEALSPLGAGGMGEVWRARDTRLAREVAVKVLPAEVSADASRLKRFEKEARAASALNHPNIVTIYDVGSADSVSFIAMELVAGKTLRELLLSGALPVKRLLRIAAQIAEGLSRAHEAGILHRDLKPENVMVTKEGLVKILDFGLAKQMGPASASDEGSHLPTETGTSPGVVLGTVGYMSPEQAGGQLVDFRSDQFSFGSILYEMATGKRAFQKKTAVDTLSAILNEDPQPIGELYPDAPAPLRWIVERCLQKEPRQRYGSTEDLARDLSGLRDHLAEATSSGSLAARVSGKRGSAVLVLRALVAGLVLVVAGALFQRWLTSHGSRAETPSVHQLTFRRGNVRSARFAPDGKTVVYAASWDGKPVEAFTVRTDSTQSRSLDLPRAYPLGVSSKGEVAILLRRTDPLTNDPGTLARVPLEGGGNPREILEDVWEADWAPNGEDLAVLHRLPNGNRALQYPIGTTLVEGNSGISGIRVSPRGDLVAFLDSNMDGTVLAIVDRKGKRSVVSQGWLQVNQFAWSPRGDELVLAGGRAEDQNGLYAVSLSGRERVLANIAHDMVLYDVASDGRLLVEYFRQRWVTVCRRAGEDREHEIGLNDSVVHYISQDGRLVLFRDSSLPGQLLLRRTDGTPPIQLGKGEGMGLSADGRWALAIRPGPPRELVLIPTGPGSVKKIPIEGVEPQQALLLPNGKGFVVLGKGKGQSLFQLFLLGPEGGKAKPVLGIEGLTLPTIGQGWAASPDGEHFAYAPNDGRLRVVAVSSGELAMVPGAPLQQNETPEWSADGRFLFLMQIGGQGEPARISRLALATGRREPWKELMPEDAAGATNIGGAYALARDGLSYAYSYIRVLASDLFVVEGVK